FEAATPLPRPAAARYTACALAEAGYAVLASSRLVPADADDAAAADGGKGGRTSQLPLRQQQQQQQQQQRRQQQKLALLHELEVYTVNGRRTARVSGLTGAVRCLTTAGRGELLVIGGDRLMLEARTTADLHPIWSLDPSSWATIDCFS
ncbi:unnamed protein product, partial [Laminaria digitata]